MKYICDWCGCEFRMPPSRRKADVKFCGSSCSGKYNAMMKRNTNIKKRPDGNEHQKLLSLLESMRSAKL